MASVFEYLINSPIDKLCALSNMNNTTRRMNSLLSILSQYIEAETNDRHFANDIFNCILLNEMFEFRV